MRRVFLIISFCVLLSNTIFSQGRTISVKGESEIEVDYDMILVSFYLKNENKDYSEALNGLKEKTEKLVTELEKVIEKEKIETRSLNVNEKREYINNKSVKTGYIASQNIEIEFPYSSEILQLILKKVEESNTDVNYSLSFKFSKKKLNSVKAELLTSAVNDAKSKAEVIAKSANIELYQIEEISYGLESGLNPYPLRYKSEVALRSAGDASYNINPGNTTVSESIIVVWSIASSK